VKSPQELGMPFDDWRPGQRSAIRTGLHSKRRHVVIQSPTGTGKSTIAAGLTRMAPGERTAILTATTGLQIQYEQTFPFLTNIWGQRRYSCLAARDELRHCFGKNMPIERVMCDRGPCRSGEKCSLKDRGCLYFDKVREAVASNAVLTNYPYWLAMRRYSRGLGHVRRLVADEAHALPEGLMDACTITIDMTANPQRNLPTTIDGWKDWAERHLRMLAPIPTDDTRDITQPKSRIAGALEDMAHMDDTWVWQRMSDVLVFAPTEPRRLRSYFEDAKTVDQIVYLSATITPQTLGLLGIDPQDVEFVAMKSPFAIAKRPVYLLQTCRVDFRSMRDPVTANYWVARMDQVIGQRLDRKGIIHTVSYDRARFVLDHSEHKRKMIAPQRASDLPAALDQFRQMDAPAIFVSPSVTTGWDFPYRDAEYQIISKLPFPDTTSAIMKARMKATPGYGESLVAQTIQQTAGRIVRASDDQGETFIMDDHARWFIPKYRALFAGYFQDAVQSVDSLPDVMPKLT